MVVQDHPVLLATPPVARGWRGKFAAERPEESPYSIAMSACLGMSETIRRLTQQNGPCQWSLARASDGQGVTTATQGARRKKTAAVCNEDMDFSRSSSRDESDREWYGGPPGATRSGSRYFEAAGVTCARQARDVYLPMLCDAFTPYPSDCHAVMHGASRGRRVMHGASP